jgi:hypothetical protein
MPDDRVNLIAGYGWTAALPPNSLPETEIAETVSILPCLAGSLQGFVEKYRLIPFTNNNGTLVRI